MSPEARKSTPAAQAIVRLTPVNLPETQERAMTDETIPDRVNVEVPEGYFDWPEERKREYIRQVVAQVTPPETPTPA
jgi:hypothetical protein